MGMGIMGNGMQMGWIYLALLIAGIFLLLKYLPRFGSTERSDKQRTPLEILKERYARGEISKKEFDTKRRDLLPL